MHEIGRLSIFGYKERELPNTFYSKPENERAALILPGSGYTCQMPLLFYSADLLLQKGYDVLCVDYAYGKRAGPDASASDLERWLEVDVQEAYSALIRRKEYKSVVVVGKSMGTIGAAYLLESGRANKVSHVVWLTPLLNNAELLKKIEANSRNVKSFLVSGSSDSHFNKDNLDGLAMALGARVLVVDGANHSLELDGDYKSSLEALKTLMEHTEQFLSGAQDRL